MKRSLIVFFISAALLFPGCAYTKIQLPLDKNFENTDLGTKQGRASVKTVLFLFSWGDSGTWAAAHNGNIQVIKHADREIYSFLFGLYTRMTTVVYGD